MQFDKCVLYEQGELNWECTMCRIESKNTVELATLSTFVQENGSPTRVEAENWDQQQDNTYQPKVNIYDKWEVSYTVYRLSLT
jgi:hypothetical protein